MLVELPGEGATPQVGVDAWHLAVLTEVHDAETLWRTIPADLRASPVVQDWVRTHVAVVLPWLPQPFGPRWLLEWATHDGDGPLRLSALATLPFSEAVGYLEAPDRPNAVPGLEAALWATYPAEMLVWVEERAAALMRVTADVAPNWAHPFGSALNAPDIHRPTIIARLRHDLEFAEVTPYGRDWVRRLFLRIVEERRAGWRSAFEALVET